MLPKQKRLSGRDITQIWKDGKATGMPFFVVRHTKQAGETPRFAVIAPKTIAKSAVLRNSIRRKWYTSLRQVIQSQQIPGGTYAFVMKKEAITLTPPLRQEALSAFFSKLR